MLHLGYEKLYSHQVEMFNEAIAGHHSVITTGTASGKSLAFYLPILNHLLSYPAQRAVFIYPTKALAQDQFKSLAKFVEYFGKHRINVGIYDGDTPASQRKTIRENCNIILTNPDMLHASLLPNHNRTGFPFLFQNLKFVVLDEIHSYRGIFGSHVSNVIRRLLRICKYHHSSPLFLCSSATIANPQELAENICHQKFSLIENDGSPSKEKEILFWQPPYVGIHKNVKKTNINTKELAVWSPPFLDGSNPYKKSITQELIELLPNLIESKAHFIAFCQSRKTTEIVTKESRDILSSNFSLESKISGYRGGFTPEERHRIEQGLINGTIWGVVSTNALELGIDIGALEIVVMGGFPGTRASFWQQVGRAGRRSNKSYAVLLLQEKAIDQFIGANPDWLIGTSPEHAIVDKNNLFVQFSHIRAAAYELPLTYDDLANFPELGNVIPLLIEEGEIEKQNTHYLWTGKTTPSQEFGLRNISNDTVSVSNVKDGTTLTSIEITQAKRELYTGAIYLHNTEQYKCINLDLEKKIAFVEPADLNYYTEPHVGFDFRILDTFSTKKLINTEIYYGYVNVKTIIGGYKMLQFYSHTNLGFEKLNPLLDFEMDTEACWFGLPQSVEEFLVGKLATPLLFGIKTAMLASSEFKVMATYRDLGGGFKETKLGESIKTGLFIFDNYPGGLGFSEKIYGYFNEIILNAISLVKNCSCNRGCPVCVGTDEIDKKFVIWALESYINDLPVPDGFEIQTADFDTKVEYPFKWESFMEDWPKIISTLSERNLNGIDLLNSAKSIEVEESTLYLFYSPAVISHINEMFLMTIRGYLSQLLLLPPNFSIQLKPAGEDNTQFVDFKLRRHLKKAK